MLHFLGRGFPGNGLTHQAHAGLLRRDSGGAGAGQGKSKQVDIPLSRIWKVAGAGKIDMPTLSDGQPRPRHRTRH